MTDNQFLIYLWVVPLAITVTAFIVAGIWDIWRNPRG